MKSGELKSGEGSFSEGIEENRPKEEKKSELLINVVDIIPTGKHGNVPKSYQLFYSL